MSKAHKFIPRYVIVSPVRDEEDYLEGTIQSVASQTMMPAEWVIVNDGSTDNTAGIIDKYAGQYRWIQGIHRMDRGFRKPGGGVVDAFNEGYKSLQCQDWDFVVKLDGDLRFEPDYFERILKFFLREPRLGIAGGTLYIASRGELNAERNPRFHVRGPTKVYRRECWEQIGGLWPGPGWDTLDETGASMKGWITMSIPDIHAIHCRPTGAADGTWKDNVKHGLVWYTVGYHPLFALASFLYRLIHRRNVVQSVGSLYGFVHAYLARVPRVNDPDLIKFIRNEQMKRLMGRETIWK